MLDTLWSIAVSGFYRGIAPNFIRVSRYLQFGMLLSFLVSQIKSLLTKKENEKKVSDCLLVSEPLILISSQEPAFQRLIFITMLAWENPYCKERNARNDASVKPSFQVFFQKCPFL